MAIKNVLNSGTIYGTIERTSNGGSFFIEWQEGDMDTSKNTTKVHAKMVFVQGDTRGDSSNSNCPANLYINNQLVFSATGRAYFMTQGGVYTSWQNGQTWEGTIDVPHNADGSAYINIGGNIDTGTVGSSKYLPGYCTASENIYLSTIPQIPQYASFSEHYIQAIGLNSISVHWNSGTYIDAVQYSLNGGVWTNISGLTYTISGLNPGIAYNVRTRIRNASSQLWTESGYLYATTKDIAKIAKIDNFEHGNNAIVEVTNPTNIANLNLTMNVDNQQIISRTVLTGKNEIQFSDTELDNLYKKYSSNDNLIATFILSGSGYTHNKDCTIIFTRKSKNSKIKS